MASGNIKSASVAAENWSIYWNCRETLSVGGGIVKSHLSLYWHADNTNQIWTIAGTLSNN